MEQFTSNVWVQTLMPCLAPRAKQTKGVENRDGSSSSSFFRTIGSQGSKAGSQSIGKRKRNQPLRIGAPTDFRRVDGGLPGMKSVHPPLPQIGTTKPLPSPARTRTYPSPSRTRPENLTMDREHTGVVASKRSTSPESAAGLEAVVFPDRNLSLRARWKLDPLPPLPSVEVEALGARERSGSESDKMKRKPVPIHIRATSNPQSPTYVPSGFAAEMLGSVPSPVELEAPARLGTPLAELGENSPRIAMHSKQTSLSSLGSPTLGRSPYRLSHDALRILTSFPTTPHSPQMTPSTGRQRARSASRGRSKTNVAAASSVRLTDRAKSASPTVKTVVSTRGALSPDMPFPTPLDIQDLLFEDPSPYDEFTLSPATPESVAFSGGRLASLGTDLGLDLGDYGYDLTGRSNTNANNSFPGPTNDFGSTNLHSHKLPSHDMGWAEDSESIHIFLAPSKPPSLRGASIWH